ncbi:MAG: diadenylate cyclase CdaA [Thermoleophilia bacterium]|nr:diadenylate cyclase CdaA [Thermoleophilia bacterium]
MVSLFGIIKNINLFDVVDILAVAGWFYFIFYTLRGSRSHVALRGMITLLLALFLIYFVARVAQMDSLAMILTNVWIVILIVFVMVFQNEFKKALTDLGQLRLFRVLFTQNAEHVNELIKAVRVMSTRHVGCLVALERRNSLRPYVETGTPIDGTIQAELIRTIFTPYSPLHDGAVILSGDRLVSAACILPLTGQHDVSKDLGTRHRSAIGLSEETDALVVVVSEETGAISLAVYGQLRRHLTPEDLRKLLEAELDLTHQTKPEADSEASV